MFSQNTHLAVFSADGLSEALNGSLLTLSSLAKRTQLTLHLIQLLLQLLQMETGRLRLSSGLRHVKVYKISLYLIFDHIVGLALVDLGLQGLDLELGLLQLADTLTGRALILVELTLLLFNKVL